MLLIETRMQLVIVEVRLMCTTMGAIVIGTLEISISALAEVNLLLY